MTPNWELTLLSTPAAKTPAAKSEPGSPNCAWLKRLKNSARKSSPTRSVSGKRLIKERSVLTKFGPEIGAREASPSPPVSPDLKPAATKQLVLNHSLRFRGPEFGSQI